MGRVGIRRVRGMGLRLLVGLGALLLAGILPLSLASVPEARPEHSAHTTAMPSPATLDHPPWQPPPLPAWRDPQLGDLSLAAAEQARDDADLIRRRAPSATTLPASTPVPALMLRPPTAVPSSSPSPPPTASRPSGPGGPTATGLWHWPLHGALSSLFGPAHPLGIDIAADPGLPVGAARAGRVAHVAFDERGYGHFLLLHHEEGWSSLYGHLREPPLVAVGMIVQPGQTLGAVGSTGNSTGPHLHFELRRHDRLLDPLTILPSMALVLGPEATRTPLPMPASTPPPTATPAASPTPTPSATPTVTPIAAGTPGPCPVGTPRPGSTPSPTPGRGGSPTPTATPTSTPTAAAATPTATATPSETAPAIATVGPAATATVTPARPTPDCDEPPVTQALPRREALPPALGSAIVRDPDGVNLRAGPGLAFPVLLALPKGMSLTVTAAADDAGWLAVRAGEREGWVRAEYVERSAEAAATATPTGKGTPAPATAPPPTTTATRAPTPTATPAELTAAPGTSSQPCATPAPSATPMMRIPGPNTEPAARPPTSTATPPPCGRPPPS